MCVCVCVCVCVGFTMQSAYYTRMLGSYICIIPLAARIVQVVRLTQMDTQTDTYKLNHVHIMQ